MIEAFDSLFIDKMRRAGIPILRIALGVIFIWFGVLKVLDISPVKELVVALYDIFPVNLSFIVLGVVEMVIGLGLIFKLGLRFVFLLMWIQMAGIFVSLFLGPSLFFQSGNPFLLTFEGEFVIKNIVLVAASIVIAGHEIQPKQEIYDRSVDD